MQINWKLNWTPIRTQEISRVNNSLRARARPDLIHYQLLSLLLLLLLHRENFTAQITAEFCNREINRHSAVTDHPFISHVPFMFHDPEGTIKKCFIPNKIYYIRQTRVELNSEPLKPQRKERVQFRLNFLVATSKRFVSYPVLKQGSRWLSRVDISV